MHTYAAFHKAV